MEDGGGLVLRDPSATFFLLMIAGTTVFLETSPLPLPGSAGIGGARKVSSQFHGSAPLPAVFASTISYLRHLSFLYWALPGCV